MSVTVEPITCGESSKITHVAITNPVELIARVETADNFQATAAPLATVRYEHRARLDATGQRGPTKVRITWDGGMEESTYVIDWGSVDCGPVAPPTTMPPCPEGMHYGAPIGGPPQCVSDAVPIFNPDPAPGAPAPPEATTTVPTIADAVTVTPEPITNVVVLPRTAPVTTLPATGSGPELLIGTAVLLLGLGGTLIRATRRRAVAR
ncbi:MAG: hypothetical protein EHM24_11220 [Acidobacteria bacterium]|nr:MAG: hypothetical protein EHM24_11220 [Acidobacteriota bacterium]